jgi:hypothetical protein
VNRLQRRTALKIVGATAAGIAAQFSGLVPELFASGAPGLKGEIDWHDLAPADLRRAVQAALGSVDGARLARHATASGFALQEGSARGVGIRADSTNGLLVYIPFAAEDGRSAQIVYANADGRAPFLALGIIDQRAAGTVRASAFVVERGNVQPSDTTIVQGDSVTVIDDRTGARRSYTIPQPNRRPNSSVPAWYTVNFAGVAAADSCSDCESAFDFLYGLGCTISSVLLCLACVILGGPAGFICALVCGVFWFLVCYLAIQINRCWFCRYTNYCYAC